MPSIGLYDYSNLKLLIQEKNKSQEEISHELSLNLRVFNQKLCGKSTFKQKEISAICKVLDIDPSDIGVYFFSN